MLEQHTKPKEVGEEIESKFGKEIPYDFWHKVMREIFENMKLLESPQYKMAETIIKAIGIPTGQISALSENLEKDKAMAQKLTNVAGVKLEDTKDNALIIDVDLRDYYEDGLPNDLKAAMKPETVAFIEGEYETARMQKRRFGKNAKALGRIEMQIHYYRLPGGHDVILRGYIHDEIWHKKFGSFLVRSAYTVGYVVIEGFTKSQLGKSLQQYWSNKALRSGEYDDLMKKIVKINPYVIFMEIDQRNRSGLSLDSMKNDKFPNLPRDYFIIYLKYLHKINPELKNIIKDEKILERILRMQATTDEGLLAENSILHTSGKRFAGFSSPNLKNLDYSNVPTGLEFGQFVFSDALSALKLHMFGKLVEEGKIEPGLLVDYQGADHVHSKAFFLKNPVFAMIIVLQTLPELMVSYVKNRADLLKEMENPNWEKLLKEIGRLPMATVMEPTPEKNTITISDTGKQRPLQLQNPEPNVFEMLGIDIKELADKLKNEYEKK